ncbi:WD repeat-containing protein 33 [Coemansia sp. RSA 2131]|nr:WD repeat-containing protein 33 [Coemansia sp. RSA 2131]
MRNQRPPGMGYNQTGRPYMPANNGQMNVRGPNMYQQGRPQHFQQQGQSYGMQTYQRPQNRPMYGNQQRPFQYNDGMQPGFGQQPPHPYYQQQQQQHQYNNPGSQQDGNPQAPKGQLQRTTIDYYGSALRGLEMQSSGLPVSAKALPADPSYTVDLPPSIFLPDQPETSIATRFVQQAINKIKSPINVAKWTPEGRRLITGSSRGELTLWNGLSFNFETIMTAHDTPIHAMEWSRDGQWIITGDHDGIIKYWQPNLSNLKAFQGHKYPVRDLSFSPTDLKFVSASDDQQLKIWDFRLNKEERQLVGHKWDVRTVDWHPHLGMIASGSKDNMIRVWDPRSAKCIATVGQHNNTVTQLQWNHNGRWLLSGGRDRCLKLFDVRKLNEEMTTFVTQREVHSVAWHPVHETMFASGGSMCDTKEMISEGSIEFWTTDDTRPKACVEGAHGSQIWSLDWHPMGHILASGSNDKTTRFWCRPRPGEHLPTELGDMDINERIFGGPINSKAAEQMASYDDTSTRVNSIAEKDARVPKSPGSSVVPMSIDSTQKSSASLPGLQSADIGRMLAKIKQNRVPGLPGLPKSQGLPGLSGPNPVQRPPLPPMAQQSGPERSEPKMHSSRFNPIRRHPPTPPDSR